MQQRYIASAAFTVHINTSGLLILCLVTDPMYQPDDPMLHTLPAKLQVVYEISDKVQRGSYC